MNEAGLATHGARTLAWQRAGERLHARKAPRSS